MKRKLLYFMKAVFSFLLHFFTIIAIGGFLSLSGSGGEKASLFQCLSFAWIIGLILVLLFICIYKRIKGVA